eukprot:jgi/Picsp_1/435/NSC_00433-R1_---NA---
MRGKGSSILRKLSSSKGKKQGGDDVIAATRLDNAKLGDKENECGNMVDRYSKDLKQVHGKEEEGMIKARYEAGGEIQGTRVLLSERDFAQDYEHMSQDVADRLVYAAIDERGMKILRMEERLEELSLQIGKIVKGRGGITSDKSGINEEDCTVDHDALKESMERLDGLVQQVLQLNMLSKSDDMKRFEALSHSIAGIVNDNEVLRNTCHVLHQQVGALLDRVCVLERNASVLSEAADSTDEQVDEQIDDVWSIPAVKADLKRLLKDVQSQKQSPRTKDDANGQSDHIMGVFGVCRAVLGAFVHHGAVRHLLMPLLAAVCVQRVSSRPSSSRVNNMMD